MSADRTQPLPRDARVGLAGRTLSGQYRIVAQLATGGMGAVYDAEHVATGQRYAIETLHDGVQHDETARRLAREANAMRWLHHPNIAEVFDVGTTDDGALYLVMELVRGASLRAVLDGGPVGTRRALVILRQALEAVAHAHGAGMVHRDLKPENLMIAQAGEPGREFDRVVVLDFGLVKLLDGAATGLGADKLTRTGVVSGTPAYMPPEQALGRLVDGRADLYALGAVAFEMLASHPPYRSPDPITLLRMQVSAPVPTLAGTAPGRPSTPALEHLVARSLAKQPDERFRDAAEMIAALDAAFASIDHLPAGA